MSDASIRLCADCGDDEYRILLRFKRSRDSLELLQAPHLIFHAADAGVTQRTLSSISH
jgi:hypothetical protein